MTQCVSKRRYSSLWSVAIPLLTVVTQCVSWAILFPIGARTSVDHDDVVQQVLLPIIVIWFFLPLLCGFGLYLGISGIRASNNVIIGVIGVFLNLVYLALFLLVCYLAYVIGIHV